MHFSPSFKQFERLWREGRSQVVSTRLVSDLETPVSAMLKLGRGRPYAFLLESIEGGAVRGRYSIIGRDPDVIWRCQNGQASVNRDALQNPGVFTPSARAPLDDLRALMAETRLDNHDLPRPVATGLFGYLGYDMVREMEKIPDSPSSPLGLPDALLVRPSLLAIFDQIENCFTLVTPAWHDPAMPAEKAWYAACERLHVALLDLQQALPPLPASGFPAATDGQAPEGNFTEKAFTQTVEKAKDYIRAGDIFQVVLSQRFQTPFPRPPFDLYRAIRRLDPSPFLFFFDFGDFAIVGSSPEILVRVRDGKVTIRPIAGTRPRGQGNRSDAELEAELLADPKELSEHLMLLDLGRNDVGRVAQTGTVRVTARNTIERYRHVTHIVSNVEGKLDPAFTALDALVAGFPAGTVSGSPKIRSMEIIAELEPDRRGLYGGCVGYFGADGDMDTCIAIRTAVVKDGVVHVQAGAGIVHDSLPLAEHRECAAKARGLLRAAAVALQGEGGETC